MNQSPEPEQNPTPAPANQPETPTNQPVTPTQIPEQTPPLVYPDLKQPAATDSSPEEPGTSWVKALLLGLLNWLVIPVVIVLILHNFVFQAFHVVGSSMYPTLTDSDYLIISKVGASEAGAVRAIGKNDTYIPKRNEIIVFHYPKDPSLIFIKRVIGLPGEHIVVKNGDVTIYNQTHPNGFDPDAGTNRTQDPTLGDIDEIIPPGQIFVMGDNRTPNGSYDSRDWGTLPSSYIIGDAVLRLLPVNQAGIL